MDNIISKIRDDIGSNIRDIQDVDLETEEGITLRKNIMLNIERLDCYLLNEKLNEEHQLLKEELQRLRSKQENM